MARIKKVVLAIGEATGHNHVINSDAVGYANDEISLADYIKVVKKLAKLEHQEHETIEIPKGKLIWGKRYFSNANIAFNGRLRKAGGGAAVK